MKRLLLVIVFAPMLLAQETRIATDFELKQMEQQAATAKDFLSQLSAHLNLGDLRRARSENSLAQEEYAKALAIAEQERKATRSSSRISDYATATLYAGLAEARRGNDARAFELLEEGIRYTTDDAQLWNVYASAMGIMHRPRKAASASRNAVALERRPLDRVLDQYSLAIALDEAGDSAEAIKGLEDVVSSLRSDQFSSLRKEMARKESFEIYSTVHNDVAAYITLLTRSQLQLANLYERRGDVALARKTYEEVLKTRSDEPIALGELARLRRSPEAFAEAFDANPFSLDLIRDYQDYVKTAKPRSEGTSSGAEMRRAIEEMSRGEDVAAHKTLEGLQAKFPKSDAVRTLLGELDANAGGAFLKDLRATLALLAQNQLTPEQRKALDQTTLTSTAIFDAVPFESGTIDGVPFKFSEPMTFNGDFPAKTPLKLTYRILGATELRGASALLVEPTRVEVAGGR